MGKCVSSGTLHNMAEDYPIVVEIAAANPKLKPNYLNKGYRLVKRSEIEEGGWLREKMMKIVGGCGLKYKLKDGVVCSDYTFLTPDQVAEDEWVPSVLLVLEKEWIDPDFE